MSCRTGCRTGGHTSWGACARAANIAVEATTIPSARYLGQKKFDTELTEYKKARDQGIQPVGTQLAQVRDAVTLSKATDSAFQGG